MWEETLDALARDPEELRDRIDWIAKRSILRDEVPEAADWERLRERGAELLARASPPPAAEWDLREKAYRLWRADLRYHELGPRGGYRRLEARGLVRRLSDPLRARRARREPPDDTRAFARGQAIKWAHIHARSGGVSWHRVRLGKFDWRWFTDPLDPRGGSFGPSDEPATPRSVGGGRSSTEPSDPGP
jgi:proteasome accessory factor A